MFRLPLGERTDPLEEKRQARENTINSVITFCVLCAVIRIDEAKLEVVRKAVEAAAASPGQRTLEEAAEALGLTVYYSEVKGSRGQLSLLKLCNRTPELAFVGRSPDDAANEAVHYIRLALRTAHLCHA